MSEQELSRVRVGIAKVMAVLLVGLVFLGSGVIAASPTPSRWAKDDVTFPGDFTTTSGALWAYTHGTHYGVTDDWRGIAWKEDDATGSLYRYSSWNNNWYLADGANDPGPKPTPRRGACMVLVQKFSTQYGGEYVYFVIIGGENAAGVPIGEVNVLTATGWLRYTYSYPEPVSYAACGARNWVGNEGDLHGITGVVVYGGKKDAAGNSNDDIWFWDTDAMEWFFIADDARVRRYGAAFQELTTFTGFQQEGIIIYGGVGPGLSPSEQRGLVCTFVALDFGCINVIETGTPPMTPGSSEFRFGASTTWTRYRNATSATGFLYFGGTNGVVSYNSVYLARTVQGGLILDWEIVLPAGTKPVSRHLAAMACIDTTDCRIPWGTDNYDPTRFVVWSGVNGWGGPSLSDTWMLTFGLSNGGPGNAGCPKCPPPVPV